MADKGDRFSFAYACLLGWMSLAVLFVPIDLILIPGQQAFTQWIWSKPIGWTYAVVTGRAAPHTGVFSDSLSLYLLMGWLFVLAVGITPLIWLHRERASRRIIPFLLQVITAYLALQLLRYGYAKLVKTQFYLPEPNTLYTPLGGLSRDLAFWSVIGTSPMYNLITGVLECLAGLGLLFKRTHRMALLLSLGIFAQVLLVNISFDISVKVFAAMLFLITWLLMMPWLRPLWQLLSERSLTALPKTPDSIDEPLKKPLLFFRIFLACMLLTELGLFASSTGWTADDERPRPPLHGAYAVRPPKKGKAKFSHFFFHRRHYLILRTTDGQDRSYPVRVDTISQHFYWEDSVGEWKRGAYRWHLADQTLSLKPAPQADSLVGQVLPWRDLPLLKQSIHWTIDQPQK